MSAMPLNGGLSLSADVRSWIGEFEALHGRAPRVLHIGNIANNAYNNAKLLNAAGLDCDVICVEYYHIMGCPEWEDADFEGVVSNQFRPNWTKVDLGTFERPRWFAQGPLSICADYLIARRSGDVERAETLWRRLAHCNKTRMSSWRDGTIVWLQGLGATLSRWARAAVVPEKVERKMRLALTSVLVRTKWRGSELVGRGVDALSRAASSCSRLLLRSSLAVLGRSADASELDDLTERLRGELAATFPGRPDAIEVDDVRSYQPYLRRWRALFEHYDIIQGYGLDPIIPMLTGHECFALEHGTLRSIPWEATSTGRLTALAYARARHVFVTNSDCLENARSLAGERVSMIAHPYDEHRADSVEGWQALRERLQAELDADFLFFFPTRHDWVAGTGYADKANDVFLRAFGELCRQGRRVGVVSCRWGRNVQESERLLREEGCARHVKWLDPVGVVEYERYVKASDVVADQFKLGAFGGVTFRALAAGTALCTYLDAEEMVRAYGESPPAINCRTSEAIVDAIERLMDDPASLARLSDRSREWMRRHHSASQTITAQLQAYSRYLGRTAQPRAVASA